MTGVTYKVWVQVEELDEQGDGSDVALPDPLFESADQKEAEDFARMLPGFPSSTDGRGESDLGQPLPGWVHHLRDVIADFNDELNGLTCLSKYGDDCDHEQGVDDEAEIDEADDGREVCAVCRHCLTVGRAEQFLNAFEKGGS